MSERPEAPAHLPWVLAAALLAVSASAVLVRGIDTVSPWSIAFWRCLGASLLLAPAARRVERRDALWIAAGGLCLGAHFATWFASLHQTTVLHSTVLVCLSPLWVGLAARVWGSSEDQPPRAFWLGTIAAILGTVAMGADPGGEVTLLGDLLALVAGLLAGAYLWVGRIVRPRVGIGAYGLWVCVAAALTLAPTLAVPGTQRLPGTPTEAGLLIACVVGPQLVGHNGVNWSLRYLPAATVSALLLLEPVGASLLAGVAFQEWPGPASALGGALVVGGVVLSQRPRQASPDRAPAHPGSE